MTDPSFNRPRSRTGVYVVLLVGIAVIAMAGWWRVGLLDLPSVPASVTLQSAGLSELSELRRLDDYIREGSSPPPSAPASDAVQLVRAGLEGIRRGDVAQGLQSMRTGIRLDPINLVTGNVYRMEVFRLRRAFLAEARARGELAPAFPAELAGEPIAFFQEIAESSLSRETRLQLALAWVDEMLLFPALEIKAPASVEAVKILDDLIAEGNEFYVPALFARGLNHLHRPARLVWPETTKTPPDAAALDIGRCIAIGRRLGAGSDRLQATLALSLGDAYVKAGRFNVARSWWQIAQNLCRDESIQSAVRLRYAWEDEEIVDRLEEELDRSRAELDRPMTDLAMMWQ